MLAPICLFTYNRLAETKETVEALKKNLLASESHLLVFSDGAKNEQAQEKIKGVRQYLKTIEGFKSIQIFEASENKGLANSIISGVTNALEQYGKVIVLEDDLTTAPNFLNFMNQALDYYETIDVVQSINGFSPEIKKQNMFDVFYHTRTFPWGWATWKDRWDADIFSKEKIKKEISEDKTILMNLQNTCGSDITKMLLDSINDKNDSWYVRWVYAHFRKQTVGVYPKYALVNNSGFNENGTHCKAINPYKSVNDTDFRNKVQFNFNSQVRIDPIINKQFLRYFSKEYRVLIRLKLLLEKGGLKILLDDIKSKI
ncbi:glycosyltransferase [Zobellia roscoffensis]|uniref:glycosyltransferase n=1 Tax=Zobellia roscoffensis TaxID=2779508 RepID=UPI00188B399B|nr:glycosyltransferase [Zobellia roscoffensis]